MTMAEASVRLQVALKKKIAAEARSRTHFLDEADEIAGFHGQDEAALRAAKEEFESCKRAVFEVARRM